MAYTGHVARLCQYQLDDGINYELILSTGAIV